MALLPTKKITALTPIASPLAGGEELECVQLSNSRKITARDLVLPSDPLITYASVLGSLPGSRVFTAGSGISIDLNTPGQILIAASGTGALAGNPTASVGLTAINGGATTWMRSDAAPALSQAIAPTWSGQHTFSLGTSGATVPIFLSSVTPSLDFNETDGSANNRRWRLTVENEQLSYQVLNDVVGAASTFIAINRTGNVVDSIALTATSVPITILSSSAVYTFDASGGLFAGIAPRLRFNSTGAAADTKQWHVQDSSAGSLVIATRTDIDGTGQTALQFDRVGTTVSSANFVNGTLMAGGNIVPNVTTAPTWTAMHTFTSIVGGQFTPAISLNSIQPILWFEQTNAAANNRSWLVFASGEQFVFVAENDAKSSGTPFITADRTGITVDSLALAATTVTVNGQDVRNTALFTAGTLPVARGGTGTTTSTGTGNVVLSASPTFSGTPGGTITSGVYVPTFTDDSNTSARTGVIGFWTRIGDIVSGSVFGSVTATVISTLTGIKISLPIASNLATDGDLIGLCVHSSGGAANLPANPGLVIAGTITHNAVARWTSESITSRNFQADFRYAILP